MSTEPDRPAPLVLVLNGLLIAAALAILVVAAGQVLNVFLLAFGAAVIAILIRGLSDPLARWGRLPERFAAAVVMLLIAAALFVFAWLFGQRISSQFEQLADILPSAWESVRERLMRLPGGAELIQSVQEGAGGNVLSRLASVLGMVAAAVTDFLLVLFGAVFIALNPGLYRRGLVALAPRAYRALADEALGASERALRLWMLGQLFSAVVVGTLVALSLTLIGLPGALALGLIAGVLEIIPYIGPILASIPALMVALTQSPEMALMTAAVFLAIEVAEGNLITPVIQKRAVLLPAALTLFGVVAAGLLFGPTGLIFAAPLLVVAYVLAKRLYIREALETATPIPGEQKG